MKYEGEKIVIKKKGMNYTVVPEALELMALVWAVGNWGLDEQVTHALRGVGFGGDGFGLSFPNDVNGQWEYEDEGIRLAHDQVLVRYGLDDDHFILHVNLYLECLRQILLLNGLKKRAVVIQTFIGDRSSAKTMKETDVQFCKYRFAKLTDILIELGWVKQEQDPRNKFLQRHSVEGLKDENIEMDLSIYFHRRDVEGYRLYYENIEMDMDVFYRSICQQLQAHQGKRSVFRFLSRKPDASPYVESLQSLVDGIHLLFEREIDIGNITRRRA